MYSHENLKNIAIKKLKEDRGIKQDEILSYFVVKIKSGYHVYIVVGNKYNIYDNRVFTINNRSLQIKAIDWSKVIEDLEKNGKYKEVVYYQ